MLCHDCQLHHNTVNKREKRNDCARVSIQFAGQVSEMGSFSSKARKPQDANELCQATEVEVNASGTAESSAARSNATSNEDNSVVASTSEEQNLPPKFRQSFSWLVDTPVVLTTGTGKEQKSNGKRCGDGKQKTSSNILKYTNGKYLKSCQHLTEMPPSDPKRPITDAVPSSSSASSSKHVQFSSCEAKHEASKNGVKLNQKCLGKRDVIPSTSGFRVGFGADGTEHICQSSTAVKTRQTSYKGNI